MGPEDLPIEIIGEVFGYLQEDTASLKRCSLVCRHLLNSARPYIFSTVCVRKNACARIVKLFVVLAPHLAKFVRRINLVLFHASPRSEGNLGWLEDLTPILQRFQNVDCLILQLVALNLLPELTRKLLHGWARTIKELHLVRVCYGDFQDVTTLLLSSRNLQSITLEMNNGRQAFEPQTYADPRFVKAEQRFPRRLQRLSIVNGKWMLEPILAALLLNSCPVFSAKLMEIPLSLCGSCRLLESLDSPIKVLIVQIDMEFMTSLPAIQCLSHYLSSVAHLEHFGLSVRQQTEGEENDLLSRMLVALIFLADTIKLPTCIRVLEFRFTTENAAVIENAEWARIDALCHDQFPWLERIVVRLRVQRQKACPKQAALAAVDLKQALHGRMVFTYLSGKMYFVYEYMVGESWKAAEDLDMKARPGGKPYKIASFLGRIRNSHKQGLSV